MKRIIVFLKHSTAVKEAFQAFGKLIGKLVNFIEAFTYAITSVSL